MSATSLTVVSDRYPACSVKFRLSVRTDLEDLNGQVILTGDAGPFSLQTYITADELEELSSMCMAAARQLREAQSPAQVITDWAAA